MNAAAAFSAARSARATLVAGAVWFTAIYISVIPRVEMSRDGWAPWRALERLVDATAPLGDIVALLLGVFMLGVLSEALLGTVARLLAVLVVRAQRRLAGRLAGEHHRTYRPVVTTVGGYLDTAVGRAHRTFAAASDAAAATRLPATEGRTTRDVLARSVRLARLDALADAPAVAADVDRLRAEAELRLQLVLAVPVLLVAFATYAPPVAALALVAAGVFAAALLASSANHCAERANDELADHVQRRRGSA